MQTTYCWTEPFVIVAVYWQISNVLLLQVILINDMVDIRTNLKLHCFNIQAAMCRLLETLLSLNTVGDDNDGNQSVKKIVSEQVCHLTVFFSFSGHHLGFLCIGKSSRGLVGIHMLEFESSHFLACK